MSIDPAILRAMAAAGASMEVILAAVEAAHAMDEAKLAEKRAKDAARQRKSRANREPSRDVTVTERDICDADASPSPEQKDPSTQKTQTPSPPLSKENPPKGGQKKGSRLPEDFAPSEDDRQFCRDLGFTDTDIDRWLLPEFCDFWRGVPGAKGTKLDWPATFRNRARDQARRRPPRGHGPPPGNSRPRSNADLMTELALEADENLRRKRNGDGPFDGEIIPFGSRPGEPSARYAYAPDAERSGADRGPLQPEGYSLLRLARS